jgi:translation elongation factor EF-G
MANDTLKQEIQHALDNATLGRTLGNFCKTYPARRINSYAGVDFEATRAGIKEVKAFSPLAEMFGYTTNLRSMTQGRGAFSMEPSHYEEVPKSVQEKVIADKK